jgi:hypothetical protein
VSKIYFSGCRPPNYRRSQEHLRDFSGCRSTMDSIPKNLKLAVFPGHFPETKMNARLSS